MADLTGATALPREVTTVPNELLEKYPHTKRVGNYLLGKTLGEGSFAKVREGLHTITGEKVGLYFSSNHEQCAGVKIAVEKSLNVQRVGLKLDVRYKKIVPNYSLALTEFERVEVGSQLNLNTPDELQRLSCKILQDSCK